MITIAQYWTPAYDCLAELTWHTKVNYAKRMGYKTVAEHLTSDSLCAERVQKWIDLLVATPEGEWIMFVGTDTLITRPDYKIEDFLPDPEVKHGIRQGSDTQIKFAVDNAGMFSDGVLIQACPETIELLKASMPMINAGMTEQHAITILLSKKTIAEYVEDVTKPKIPDFWNASYEALNASECKVGILTNDFIGDYQDIHYGGCSVADCHAWHDETFILHMGGKSLETRLKLLPTFLPKPKRSMYDLR